jgi:ribosomal protein S18 acetylase RimI-like enzyme
MDKPMNSNKKMEISIMNIKDYDEVYELWKHSEGLGLSDADTRQAIQRYLQHNPGMSFVARVGSKLAGAVLSGTDGRRGYLHHLAVAKSFRKLGIGRELVERCISALGKAGITRCHIFVFRENKAGKVFWEQVGWFGRNDLEIMSRDTKTEN